VLESALAEGLIVKKGSWLSYEGEQIGQGNDAARAFLEQNPAIVETLTAAIREKHAARK